MLHKTDWELSGSLFSKYATIYLDTDYLDTDQELRGCILYFHGGGLLYGDRHDLPLLHLNTLTQAGYAIIAFDYPLAPAAKLDMILGDVCASIQSFIEESPGRFGRLLPYYLWGRSAGAYLCLLAAAKGNLTILPRAVLSFYGYGFLCDGWFDSPSKYYCSLPSVPASCLDAVPQDIHAAGDLDTHYSVYVYARQTGKWADLLYEGRKKYFFLDYSLRTCEKFPCPLFCAHSIKDPDVPYNEFLELCSRYNAQRFIASCDMHDFDRDESNAFTGRLLEAVIKFLAQQENKKIERPDTYKI